MKHFLPIIFLHAENKRVSVSAQYFMVDARVLP